MDKIILLKLASFVATDGGIYKKRNQVFFDSTDENLINSFVAVAKQAGAQKVFINKVKRGCREAYFYSKRISGEISEILGERKTLPLKEIENLLPQDIQQILKILFTLNEKNLLSVQKLLSRFGIVSRIYGSDLVIKGFHEISKFRSFVGFIEGAKVTGKSKIWKGFEKNELLDILLKSYRDTRGK